jgi:hypothetical protein
MSYKMVSLARNYKDLSVYQPAMSQAIGVATLGGLSLVIGYALSIVLN